MGEFRTRWVLLACALCVCIPALGERVEDLGCFVEWGLQSLTVGNGHFERR